MFLSWALLLYLPRVVAHAQNANEWNSAAVAVAMGGAAWVLAARAGTAEPRPLP